MKRRILIASIAGIVALTASPVPVGAQQNEHAMTDSHIQRIKQNCSSAKRTIQQLHTNDGPLRVNRGQVYASISSRLMTPLNSRLIVNKLDASSLVKISAQYDTALSAFIDTYIKYDNQMTTVLSIDCVKQPIKFYDAVALARERRVEVHTNVAKLHELIVEYDKECDIFRTQFTNDTTKDQQ